jgi:hypothetical protein
MVALRRKIYKLLLLLLSMEWLENLSKNQRTIVEELISWNRVKTPNAYEIAYFTKISVSNVFHNLRLLYNRGILQKKNKSWIITPALKAKIFKDYAMVEEVKENDKISEEGIITSGGIREPGEPGEENSP